MWCILQVKSGQKTDMRNNGKGYVVDTWVPNHRNTEGESQSFIGRMCCPGGDLSRAGVVILVASEIVHWASNRQSGSVLSVHEADINGAIQGTKIGIATREHCA